MQLFLRFLGGFLKKFLAESKQLILLFRSVLCIVIQLRGIFTKAIHSKSLARGGIARFVTIWREPATLQSST